MDTSSSSSLHVVLFPFMSKGHTIPILNLAHLLLHRRRDATLTIFTTPANHLFISDSLPLTTATTTTTTTTTTTRISIVDLPFPENIPGVPPGIESTDKLPTMSAFPSFAIATKQMKPYFEKSLETISNVSFMITDGFLSWTLHSANKYGIPRLVYYGMNAFSMVITRAVVEHCLLISENDGEEPFPVPEFPWVKLTRKDFDSPFTDREPTGPLSQFVAESTASTAESYGLVVNTFYELESIYIDFWKKKNKGKMFCVGPLCLGAVPDRRENVNSIRNRPFWMEWLDHKLHAREPVMYIAFGSQAELSPEQVREIKLGLESSDLSFLWVTRTKQEQEEKEGFEDRVRGKGLVVREWVEQREILGHESIRGFLSHCGWNSITESIVAKVPVLAWPVMADQMLNARFVVEVMKIGVRVETFDGSVKGFVKADGFEKVARELMEGEMGAEARRRVAEVGNAAVKAFEEGGSSWQELDSLISDLHA